MNNKQRKYFEERIQGLESRVNSAIANLELRFTPWVTLGDVWQWIEEGKIRMKPGHGGERFGHYEFFSAGPYARNEVDPEIAKRLHNPSSTSEGQRDEALRHQWERKIKTTTDYAMLVDGEEAIVGLILQLEKEVEELEQEGVHNRDRVNRQIDEFKATHK